MTAATILQVILWLAPHVGEDTADWYARSIVAAADEWRVDPVDVLSVIQKESEFNPNAISDTNDYGLGQIHVGRSTHVEYINYEHRLLDPQLNIWLTAKSLRYWHRHHWKYCRDAHLYVAHYKWGNRVRRGWQSRRFLLVFRRVIAFLQRLGRPSRV
jgi:soluble lytic murein transglycosylase-like protein